MAPLDGRQHNTRLNGHGQIEVNAPPSSILATRLAQTNGSDVSVFDAESFAQLLDACLSFEDDGEPSLSSDVAVNQRLITLIVNAGIDRVSTESHALSDDQGREGEQLARCLEVIDVAIQKSPDVLFSLSDLDASGPNNYNVPLFAWLTIKLLPFLGDGNNPNYAIVSKAKTVICTIISAATRCSNNKGGSGAASAFIISCISGIISLVESTEINAETTSKVSLVDCGNILKKYFKNVDLTTREIIFKACEFTIPQVIVVACRLLEICSTSITTTTPPNDMIMRQTIFLLLDQFQHSWTLLLRYVPHSTPRLEFPHALIPEFFESLQKISGPITQEHILLGMRKRFLVLWSSCIYDLFDIFRFEKNTFDQVVYLQVLNTTRELLRDSPDLVSWFSAEMGGSLAEEDDHDILRQLKRAFNDLLQPQGRTLDNQNINGARLSSVVMKAVDERADFSEHPGRARKRLRLSTDEKVVSIEKKVSKSRQWLNRLLGGQDTAALHGPIRVAPSQFQNFSEADQCSCLDLLGRIACEINSTDETLLHYNIGCRVCDAGYTGGLKLPEEYPDEVNELLEVLKSLVPALQKANKARVVGLLSLQRLLTHSASVDTLKLAESVLGEWCLQSLRSSSREVRIAAAAALTPFVCSRATIRFDIIRTNRVVALDFLQSLWAKKDAAIQEAVILALTQIAQVCGDEELHIILSRLVEYLGHPNPYISGLVYSELQKLAQRLGMPPAALLRPFWRTLGVTIIKNFQSRPIIAQQLCDLLGLEIEGLLILIEEHVLPYLVLSRKQDLIARIALAHGSSVSPFDLCTQRRNLASILSFLLTQTVSDPEQAIMSALVDVSRDFNDNDLSGWIRLDPDHIACELLKAVVDASDTWGSRAYQALHFLAQLDQRRSGHSSSSRKNELVSHFLETNVLGIISEFTNTLNDMEIKQPNSEKKRCIAAIGEVLKLGKSRVAVALPQICGCLRSAMENEELCNDAFDAWVIMMNSLKEDNIEPLIDQTLAIIVRSWDNFRTDTQEAAYALVSDLLRNHTSLIREIFSTMPSLASIPLMAKFEGELDTLKRQLDTRHSLLSFVKRLRNENVAVVEQALEELIQQLDKKQEFLYQSILREQPDSFVADLTRSLLECCVKFNMYPSITLVAAQCLGRISCLDPNKIESTREKKSLIVFSNFARAEETVTFILFLLEEILVNAFLSTTSTRSQGFLAWAMQELLKLSDIDETVNLRSRASASQYESKRWLDLAEPVRNTLIPFLSSRYTVNSVGPPPDCAYPVISHTNSHADWLRTLVTDLLQKGTIDNAIMIFTICSRLVKGQDISITAFLLPYVALHVIVGGIESDKSHIVGEILAVLQEPLTGNHQVDEKVRLCSESIFEILDHIAAWIQGRKKELAQTISRNERGLAEPSVENTSASIKSVENILASIPPNQISRRAVECKSYARALFHWEQYIRRARAVSDGSEEHLVRLQEIYSQIDEPDGIEGIAAQLSTLSIDQQILEHRKAGRWTTAQSWYELKLADDPEDSTKQTNLMTCLKESGQFDVLLNQFDALNAHTSVTRIVPFAIEACWTTSRWEKLDRHLGEANDNQGAFSVAVGEYLSALYHGDRGLAEQISGKLYQTAVVGLTPSSTASFQACHDVMFKLHTITELRDISNDTGKEKVDLIKRLEQRLEVLGVYNSEKQYLLGLRRAAMELSPSFDQSDIATSWLSTAKLSRKRSSTNQAFNATLRATSLGDKSATIEQAKLMWTDGHQRIAIQTLEGAIESGAFKVHNTIAESGPVTLTTDQQQHQNLVMAKAYLLLGKWLDAAGQTPSEIIIKTYRKVTEHYRRWEKGWYHLGKHYNKILESEQAKPIGKESQAYLTGEASKVVIDNFLRSLTCGSKYVFQTLPKVLTLWMKLVDGLDQPQDPRQGNEKFHTHNLAQKKKVVDDANAQVKKYVEKMPAVVLYTILSQVVARICHPDRTVYSILVSMVVKIVRAFPQQALWTLYAVVKSQSRDRGARGSTIISKIVETQKKVGKDTSAAELRSLIIQGQKVSDELLRVSDFRIEGRTPRVSLARDLGFQHKIAPSRLVVPIESCLNANLPTSYEPAHLKSFRAFAKDSVTITAFLDEALVLASLQKPRKLSIRGSDGKVYGLLAKPKDDMRKDQRLMEFNTMINRFLKRDIEASKRQLYIRTYAVVPLNEECGLIEWVDNLKTFRDILLSHYKARNVAPNYIEIRNLLDEACSDPAGTKFHIFTDQILKIFSPPVFHEWFVDAFPDPAKWFAARLRYTRSCAVMSMVGHALGLGDRHGENILFEEDNGGTLHVDFNCLFDKGLTFDKPEMVPFRLTHNMVDAMGAHRYDGPFRRTCEITLGLLRANEDALMTILETFLHDPTTDFINAAAKGKKKTGPGSRTNVPDTPAGVLDAVRGKVRGMLAGESVPLSVGGYVEEMIKRATATENLAKMYIGWCAFF